MIRRNFKKNENLKNKKVKVFSDQIKLIGNAIRKKSICPLFENSELINSHARRKLKHCIVALYRPTLSSSLKIILLV